MEARIINLEPDTEIDGISFEEAFGEHSELRGKGRARRMQRRQERRMKGIENKRERKLAKQDIRLEKRRRRKSLRQEGQEPEMETQLPDSLKSQPSEYAEPQYAPETSYPSNSDYSEQQESSDEALPDNSSYQDESPTFEEETSGEESSFDGELKPKDVDLDKRIEWNKKAIDIFGGKLQDARGKLQSGKLKSNEVAQYAKMVKDLSEKIKSHKKRLSDLQEYGIKSIKKAPVKSTVVSKELDSKIMPNEIIIEPKVASSFDGDSMSSFDAKEVISKNKGIIIGVAVAGIAIFALHKMGVFKKK